MLVIRCASRNAVWRIEVINKQWPPLTNSDLELLTAFNQRTTRHRNARLYT